MQSDVENCGTRAPWRGVRNAMWLLLPLLLHCQGASSSGSPGDTAGTTSSTSSSGNTGPCESTRGYFNRHVWAPFMGQACTACHTPDGVAVTQGARFILQPSSYPGFLESNLQMVQDFSWLEYRGTPVILLKPVGGLEHGGGQVLAPDGPEMAALKSLVERLDAPSECAQDNPRNVLASVTLQSPVDTLRKLAFSLVGRVPSQQEMDLVASGGEAALPGVMDAMMQEPGFRTRLRQLFNDVLLTDRFTSYIGRALDEVPRGQFPGVEAVRALPYDDPVKLVTNNSLAWEPLNLMAYVITQGRPFHEVLTANYTVVNPMLARVYGVQGLTFQDSNDPEEFKEAHVTSSDGVAVPHAGVLSTPAWLTRFPTSPTNRNRHRARMLFKQWLATDILRLAERPIDTTLIITVDNPTRDATSCSVCHRVMDPVAGGWRGFNDYAYAAFDPMAAQTGWHTEMFASGFSDTVMPPGDFPNALPWLAQQVTQDPRFAVGAVHLAYTSFTGREPLAYPQDPAAPDFQDRVEAWEAQDAFFQDTAAAFLAANQDWRVAAKAVLLSPYFRAAAAPEALIQDHPALLVDLGLQGMLTPEELTRKIAVTTGVPWRKPWDWDRSHDWLMEEYRILMGGMDSDTINQRVRTPNSMTSRVVERMAQEASCRSVAHDFTHPAASRVLFPLVELQQEPKQAGAEVPANVTAIKTQLVALHERLLGEVLPLDSEEIARTYSVFVDTWQEYQTADDADLPWSCQGRWDNTTGVELPEGQVIGRDEHHTVRAWMAVVTYLLMDWRFTHQW